MTWSQLGPLLWQGTVETVYMTLWASVIAYALGLPLGILLVITRRDHILPMPIGFCAASPINTTRLRKGSFFSST